MYFINYIINLIYPNVCGICENISKEDICPKCKIKLNNISKVKTNIYNNKFFIKHIYVFKYEGIIKEKLIKFKFNESPYIYKAFVKFLLNNKKVCCLLKRYDIIIPVPIHNNRKLKRGYNQSALIAKKIAKNLNIQYEENVLLKKINNNPQSTKSKIERYKNVIGVYAVKNEYKIIGKKIIILDDIFTTGNTVNECSKILKKYGARQIDVLTIAKD